MTVQSAGQMIPARAPVQPDPKTQVIQLDEIKSILYLGVKGGITQPVRTVEEARRVDTVA
jgi:hypothetical protein